MRRYFTIACRTGGDYFCPACGRIPHHAAARTPDGVWCTACGRGLVTLVDDRDTATTDWPLGNEQEPE